ncbi:hypothetical protein GGI35DRAFT_126739 [Trichoderma velutinum]
MGTSQTDPRYYIEIFVDALDTDEKEPSDFRRRLIDVKYKTEASNEKLFFDHGGLSAWAAFYLVKHISKRRRARAQPGLLKIVRDFENEPDEIRIAVATGINEALPSEVRTKYQDYTSNPNKRRQGNEDQQQTFVHTPVTLADDIEASTDTLQDSVYFRLSRPSALRATDLFPEVLSDAISQQRSTSNSNAWTAGIEMAFAVGKNFDNKLDSVMSITIASDQVTRLAKDLFDVHIVAVPDGRRAMLDKYTGVKTHPRPELAIYGCKREVISETFGEIIASAIKASPAYMQEEAQGRRRTECVNMTFTAMVNDVAIINLYMAERESFWVKRALWGN